MKKQVTIKPIIGLSQEEMSQILGITRTQWAMYDTGKRNLPLVPLQKFADLLQHITDQQVTSAAVATQNKVEEKLVRECLQKELETTAIKLYKLGKKLENLKSKRAECFAALKSTDYLMDHQSPWAGADFISSIKKRALATLKIHSLTSLELLQLEKEQLENRAKILNNRMKKNLK